MNPISFSAFADELSDIFGLQKESAGMLRDIGGTIGNTLKGFTTPIQATKAGIQESFNPAGRGAIGKVFDYGLGIGLPALSFKYGVLPAEDPSREGRSRLQRAAEFGAGTAGGFIGMGAARGSGSPITSSIVGSMLGSALAEKGTRALFRGGKAIRNKLQKTPDAPMGTQPGELETPHVPVTGERPADIAG